MIQIIKHIYIYIYVFHLCRSTTLNSDSLFNYNQQMYMNKNRHIHIIASPNFAQQSKTMYALDVDDSDAELKELTRQEIGAFHIKTKDTQKSKSNNKKKIQSKSKNKNKSKAKSKSKSKKKSSSESSDSSVKEIIEKKVREKKKKSQPYIPQTPEQRFNKQVKESDLIKYGNAKFIKNGTKSPLARYDREAKDIIRTGVTWWISEGKYLEQGWPSILSDTYEIETRDLRLHNNKYSNIIKQIHHIRLENLQILTLYDNNIKSIELIARLKLTQLKDLSLRSNHITSLRSLAKMGLENLQIINIADNFIIDMSTFYHINCLSLVSIFLEWKSSNVVGQDISWLAKLKKNPSKVHSLQKVVIQSKNRINQRGVDEMLCNKFRQDIKQFLKRKMGV